MRIPLILLLLLLLTGQHNLLRAQEPGSPMACTIRGKVVCICGTKADNPERPCGQYPCQARVAILQVMGCGSSVTHPLNVGDTVLMHFAYTLHKTKKIFPKMRKQYPGLKRKKVFTANAEQKILPGNVVRYIVYDYTLQ